MQVSITTKNYTFGSEELRMEVMKVQNREIDFIS